MDLALARAYERVRSDGSTVVLYGVGKQHPIPQSRVVYKARPRLYQISLIPDTRFLAVTPKMVATDKTDIVLSTAAYLDSNVCFDLLSNLRGSRLSSGTPPLRQHLDALKARGLQLFPSPFVAESLGRRPRSDLALFADYVLTSGGQRPEDERISEVVSAWNDWATNEIAGAVQEFAYPIILKACIIANAPSGDFPDPYAELAAFLHYDLRNLSVRNYATACEMFERSTKYFKALGSALRNGRTWDDPEMGVRRTVSNIAWDMAHIQSLELHFFMAADGADFEPGIFLTYDKQLYQMAMRRPYVLRSITKPLAGWHIEPAGTLANFGALRALAPFTTPKAVEWRQRTGDADIESITANLEAQGAAVFGCSE